MQPIGCLPTIVVYQGHASTCYIFVLWCFSFLSSLQWLEQSNRDFSVRFFFLEKLRSKTIDMLQTAYKDATKSKTRLRVFFDNLGIVTYLLVTSLVESDRRLPVRKKTLGKFMNSPWWAVTGEFPKLLIWLKCFEIPANEILTKNCEWYELQGNLGFACSWYIKTSRDLISIVIWEDSCLVDADLPLKLSLLTESNAAEFADMIVAKERIWQWR